MNSQPGALRTEATLDRLLANLSSSSASIPKPQVADNQLDNAESETRQTVSPAQNSVPNSLLSLLNFGSSPSANPINTGQKVLSTPPRSSSIGQFGSNDEALLSETRLAKNGRSGTPTSSMHTPKRSERMDNSHQNSLLKLLNADTSKLETQSVSMINESAQIQDQPGKPDSISADSPAMRYFGSTEAVSDPVTSSSIPGQTPKAKSSIFTYINPFEQLAASSPRNQDLSKKAHDTRGQVTDPAKLRSDMGSKSDLESPLTEAERHRLMLLHESMVPLAATSEEAPKLVADMADKKGHAVRSRNPSPKADSITVSPAVVGGRDNGIEPKSRADNDVGDKLRGADRNSLDMSKDDDAVREASSGPPETVPALMSAKYTPDATASSSTGSKVPVYQCPLKPFVSIDIALPPSKLGIPPDAIINVARFKKEFDQIDRTLVTATRDFIVYGMPKSSGVRVIQQDSGTSSLIFSNGQDRIFNLFISKSSTNSPAKSLQRVIATGASGAVYWTQLQDADHDLSALEMVSEATTLPPIATGTESASNGVLKTRAKRSCRHPEFFGVGRGKNVHIIFPEHAHNSPLKGKDAVIDTERYLTDRSLKVSTGKAGKDFAFSEDDTVITTLDKAGKLRFWDIRDLIANDNASPSVLAPIEIKQAILTYNTGSYCAGKPWPTSVLFVDKIRSYNKGIAQRYVLLGMKQNHTLQLWDLSLGKAVQELNFPHSTEADAVCSLSYHPGSGIIALGHPTRNSVFFIHLSAPRYNLPSMSQAKYLMRIADGDSTLPKAEATAIMSGLREYSLADLGQLRSLDLVATSDDSKDIMDTSPHLFEIYAMHSKGVTCFALNRENLGWTEDYKIQQPIDAQSEGYIRVKDLRESALVTSSLEARIVSDSMNKASAPKTVKTTNEADTEPQIISSAKDAGKPEKNKRTKASSQVISTANGDTVSASQKLVIRQQGNHSQVGTAPTNDNGNMLQPNGTVSKRSGGSDSGGHEDANILLANNTVDSLPASKELVEPTHIGQDLTGLNEVISREFEALYRHLGSDRQVQNATSAANQEAILRLVSKQLGENVEQSLKTIITRAMGTLMTPELSQAACSTLENRLPDVLRASIDVKLRPALEKILPGMIKVMAPMSNLHHEIVQDLKKYLNQHFRNELPAIFQSSMSPAIDDMKVRISTDLNAMVDKSLREQSERVDSHQAATQSKLNELTASVHLLSNTIRQMAQSQTEYQSEILRLQQRTIQPVNSKDSHVSPTPSESASLYVDPQQQEAAQIAANMQDGNFEDATIMWLQSTQQAQLFDQIFTQCDPSYLRRITPLVVLSVGAAVTGSFEHNVQQRLNWLENVLACIEPNEPEIEKVARKVLDVISQRLSSTYMRIAEDDPTDPVLRRFALLTRRAQELVCVTPAVMK